MEGKGKNHRTQETKAGPRKGLSRAQKDRIRPKKERFPKKKGGGGIPSKGEGRRR